MFSETLMARDIDSAIKTLERAKRLIPKQRLTVSEVAELVRLKPATIREHIRTGKLNAIQHSMEFGGHKIFISYKEAQRVYKL